MTTKVRLAIDFGTSHTVAVLDPGTGIGQPLLFGDSPLLPSAVHAADTGQLLTGRDAVRSARMAPESFEPNPKRRIDDGTVLLGGREYPVATLISSVLRMVAVEANRVAGGPPQAVAMTHPANWGSARLGVLRQAAEQAGLGRVELIPEPEAAAVFFTASESHGRSPDTVVVYDFGGGTFDVCVLTRTGGEYRVRAQAGLDDVGGADLDAALLNHIGHVASSMDPATWQRIMRPVDAVTRRAFRSVYEDIRDAKEQLSRNSSGLVHIPLLDRDLPVTREEFEQVARPLIERTVELTASTLAGVRGAAGQPVSLYLVGGSSRVPMVSTLLHRRLGQAPVITGQPEQVVAQGALRCLDEPNTDAHRAQPLAVAAPAMSLPPTREASLGMAEAATGASSKSFGRKAVVRTVLAVVTVAAVIAAFTLLNWGKAPEDSDNGGNGNGSSADTDAAHGKSDDSDKTVDVKVSKEPDIASFMDDDDKQYLGCYYADVADTGHPAECDEKNANRGFTRQVSHQDECGDKPEEDGWRSVEEGIYCQTVLVKKKACLDKDFYTVVCDDEGAVFVVKDGPVKSKDDCAGHKGVVQLSATEKYFCFDGNDA
ncbi:Heat shock protein 70 [Stackebrandtia nassauensis DSM 44728]|uniref:Heat shock protein 70 n=1 Tax=Stackebrandtia nassauensis (strain DSM 44728 / CIP 108903 / NRRL B-16338 / NBRC 102104 / LLR-40K-21) TaxID=446470 RepID=D3Q799_STANL|nr:Heat shock protein 70 [Stackebrandtia nassauensis DSM 44728]